MNEYLDFELTCGVTVQILYRYSWPGSTFVLAKLARSKFFTGTAGSVQVLFW